MHEVEDLSSELQRRQNKLDNLQEVEWGGGEQRLCGGECLW